LTTQKVQLRFRKDTPAVLVRELTGEDERRVCDAGTQSAVELLARIVEWPTGTDGDAADLPAPDRDRLLAAVYRQAFGKKVESAGRCTSCASPYDLTFSLDDLIAEVERSAEASAVQPLGDGTFRTASGLRFRLPTARDEMEVASLPLEEAARTLASRCLVESSTGDWLEELEEAIEEAAPVLDLDIDTRCPECGAPQRLRFDVQFYLLRALEQERGRMLREIHRIASAYGWSMQEILALERSERRALTELIEADQSARRRSA
jgi:hypothetical protein